MIRQGINILFVFLLAAGYAANSHAATITWYGHSFFKIADPNMTIVIDPFDDSMKYYLPKQDINADGLLISKNSFDHNNAGAVNADTVITDVGVFEINSVKIKVSQVHSDEKQGILRGTNLVFNWKSDGIRYLYMGDIGEQPSETVYKAVGKTDVIFVPAGGTYTLEPEDIKKIIERTGAKVIIPMHYKTAILKPLWISLHTVEQFKKLLGTGYPVVNVIGTTMDLAPDALPDTPTIYVLDYPHNQKEVDGE